jgi:guanine deaminase
MTVLRARVLSPRSPVEVDFWPDAVLAVEGGVIREIAAYDGRPVDEHLRSGVLSPGFVDAHVHFPQTRIVGAASGPLLQWLTQSAFPEEERFADPDHARQVAAMFATALAAAGTTLAFAYGSVHAAASDALFAAIDRAGLRLIGGPVLMDVDCPDSLRIPAERAIPALEALVDRWDGRDGRIAVAVVPRFALSCSTSLMKAASDLAHRRGLWVSTHLSENPEECRVARERFGTGDYLQIYEDLGLIHGRTVLAHCIHLSDGEWDRIARARAVVAHCPDSNAFLGSGHFPTLQAVGRDVPLALGTDIAAGRSFRVARTASFAHDNALAAGTRIQAETLLWWATRGAALALGQGHVGAIAPGLAADLVWHDVPEWVDTAEDTLAWLLFDGDAPRPRRTWVAGRVVWDRALAAGGYPWEHRPEDAS